MRDGFAAGYRTVLRPRGQRLWKWGRACALGRHLFDWRPCVILHQGLARESRKWDSGAAAASDSLRSFIHALLHKTLSKGTLISQRDRAKGIHEKQCDEAGLG